MPYLGIFGLELESSIVILEITEFDLSYYHVTYEFQSESTLCRLPECQGNPCLKQAPYLKLK